MEPSEIADLILGEVEYERCGACKGCGKGHWTVVIVKGFTGKRGRIREPNDERVDVQLRCLRCWGLGTVPVKKYATAYKAAGLPIPRRHHTELIHLAIIEPKDTREIHTVICREDDLGQFDRVKNGVDPRWVGVKKL